MGYCNLLIFSMLAALGGEKTLFRPFVFKMVAALGVCAVVGHKFAMQSVGGEARNICIINPFLLRLPGAEAEDQARSSAGVPPMPITARAAPE